MSYDDEQLHPLPNYFRIHYSGGTLHYVCNILSNNFRIGRVQESGGSDVSYFRSNPFVLNLLAFG